MKRWVGLVFFLAGCAAVLAAGLVEHFTQQKPPELVPTPACDCRCRCEVDCPDMPPASRPDW